MTLTYLSRVLAGTDTSRVTLSIMIGLVVEHPEVQKKLHQELDDVLGEKNLDNHDVPKYLLEFQSGSTQSAEFYR